MAEVDKVDEDVFMSLDFGIPGAADDAAVEGTSAGSLFAAGREDEELEDIEDDAGSVQVVTSGSSEDADYEADSDDSQESLEAQLLRCEQVLTETLRSVKKHKRSIHKRREQYDE